MEDDGVRPLSSSHVVAIADEPKPRFEITHRRCFPGKIRRWRTFYRHCGYSTTTLMKMACKSTVKMASKSRCRRKTYYKVSSTHSAIRKHNNTRTWYRSYIGYFCDGVIPADAESAVDAKSISRAPFVCTSVLWKRTSAVTFFCNRRKSVSISGDWPNTGLYTSARQVSEVKMLDGYTDLSGMLRRHKRSDRNEGRLRI